MKLMEKKKTISNGNVFTFENFITGNYLYVDKTRYIHNLVASESNGCYFLSRPRRFGKSLLLSTLKAIFEGKKELFEGLYIANSDYAWKTHPVIHLSFGNYNVVKNAVDELPEYLMSQLRFVAMDYGITLQGITPGNCFTELIKILSMQGQVVILIDEYDKPILNNILSPNIREIFQILKGFYSTIKDCNEQERFVFITGVSKFAHISIFSDLNNLTDISMDEDYSAILGYTQEELEANFSDYLRPLAEKRNFSYEAFLKKIKRWYDGFRFHPETETVYNPVSVARFINGKGSFSNHWISTGTPSFLFELAKKKRFNFADIKSNGISDMEMKVGDIDSVQLMALLFQTGYLTIDCVKSFGGVDYYFLRFPNFEVQSAFSTQLLSSYLQVDNFYNANFALNMFKAMCEGKTEEMRRLLTAFMAGIPYPAAKLPEYVFQGMFFSIFKLIGADIRVEDYTCRGRIDAVLSTPGYIYIFELKLDCAAERALEQIHGRGYYEKFQSEGKNILLIGTTFSSEDGHVIDWQAETL